MSVQAKTLVHRHGAQTKNPRTVSFGKKLLQGLVSCAMVASTGCMTANERVEVCQRVAAEKLVESESSECSGTWRVQSPPPAELDQHNLAAVEEFCRFSLEGLDLLWLQNSCGDYGLCAVDVRAEEARVFATYAGKAIETRPVSCRVLGSPFG